MFLKSITDDRAESRTIYAHKDERGIVGQLSFEQMIEFCKLVMGEVIRPH
jgi:hypothetical protein